MPITISATAQAVLTDFGTYLETAFAEGVDGPSGSFVQDDPNYQYQSSATRERGVFNAQEMFAAFMLANASGGSGYINTLGLFGTTPNAYGGTITGSVLTLQPADATNPGGVSTTSQVFAGAKRFQDSTVFGSAVTPTMITAPLTNRVGINTASPSYTLDVNGIVRSQTGGFIFPDAKQVAGITTGNGLNVTANLLNVNLATGALPGTISAANYTKLSSLQPIYTIGAGLTLTGTTLSNTSPLTGLSIDTYNIGGPQAKALYFDGTSKISLSDASETTPGGVGLSNQVMGAGVKTFHVEGINTTLATLSNNELRISAYRSELHLTPVLKFLSGPTHPVAQLYATDGGIVYLEGATGFNLGATGYTNAITYLAGNEIEFNAPEFHNSQNYFFDTLTAYADVDFSGASSIILSDFSSGQALFNVLGTNASVGTASTNQITIRNNTTSAQMWLKFNYAGTDKAGIRSDSFGSMVLDGSSDTFFMRSGTTKAQITSTALQPGTAAGTNLGTSTLPWGQPFFQLTGTNYFLGTSSTNEMRFNNTNTGTGQTGLKFYYGGTPKGQMFCDPVGIMFWDTVNTGAGAYRWALGGTSVAQGTNVLQLGLTSGGLGLYGTVITTAGTSATINKIAGRIKLAAGNSIYTVANSLVSANSIILLTMNTNAGQYINAVPGAGTITITRSSTTGNVEISFLVINAI